LFLPALAVGIAVAGPALAIFGENYTAAAPALRVLLLGAAFRLVVVHAIGLRQAIGDAIGFARLQWVTTVLVLVLVLVVPTGLGGGGALLPVALGYLGVQVAAAGWLLVTGRRGTPGATRKFHVTSPDTSEVTL
jgi:O-antigen/teichoic acid export membrane protein